MRSTVFFVLRGFVSRRISARERRRTAKPLALLTATLVLGSGPIARAQEMPGILPAVTNVAQLCQADGEGTNAPSRIHIAGNVWWANPAQRKLVLHDASGTAELTLDFKIPAIESGRSIRVDGVGIVTRRGADFRISAAGPRLGGGGTGLRLEVTGRGVYPELRWLAIGQTLVAGDEDPWAEVEGEVTLANERSDSLELELSAMGGHMRVEVGDFSGLSAATLLHRRIRAIGYCESAFTAAGMRVPGILLVPSRREIEFIESPVNAETHIGPNPGAGAATVTTAEAISRMKSEEAERGYPVRLQGVVICVVSNRPAFIMQDATRAVYVVVDSANLSELPQVGTYLEVQGKTDKGSFAPIVRAGRVNILGLGSLPEPIRPTWDQLMNGTLDDQWVELKGVVVAISPLPLGWTSVRLRTQDGTLPVDFRLPGMTAERLARFENAVVRLRGCLFVSWDIATGQVRRGIIRMYVNDLAEDEPAPADIFEAPAKKASDLVLYDPQASAFQRVKISGQVLFVQGTEGFMMDGTNGVRFLSRRRPAVRPGDLAEVVGFPELGGAAPVLSEADDRRAGHAPLPRARRISPDDLTRADNDSTRVCIDAVLAGIRKTETNQVLEMQAGPWRFPALLRAPAVFVESFLPGSQLELTGVYAATGGSRSPGGDVASFELLLSAPADIRVLATPPWWTLRRLLVAVGLLTCALAFMALWISQLHRQVEKRTAELEVQIQNRQRLEQQRTLEQERARIAHDLHDELGSAITEIGMLAARARPGSASDDKRAAHLSLVGEKAREMVTALDEIVWAMNPAHDSLGSVVSYFCLYADRFLGLANIRWRLDDPAPASELTIDSRHRHQLFLAFKEALHNVVRHSGATEVRLGIQAEAGQLRLTIADNGRGLPSAARTEEMDGVDTMRSRIQKLGGQFEISSGPGKGTTVSFRVPAK